MSSRVATMRTCHFDNTLQPEFHQAHKSSQLRSWIFESSHKIITDRIVRPSHVWSCQHQVQASCAKQREANSADQPGRRCSSPGTRTTFGLTWSFIPRSSLSDQGCHLGWPPRVSVIRGPYEILSAASTGASKVLVSLGLILVYIEL